MSGNGRRLCDLVPDDLVCPLMPQARCHYFLAFQMLSDLTLSGHVQVLTT